MYKIISSYQLDTINSTELIAEFKQQMNLMEHELKEIMEHESSGGPEPIFLVWQKILECIR